MARFLFSRKIIIVFRQFIADTTDQFCYPSRFLSHVPYSVPVDPRLADVVRRVCGGLRAASSGVGDRRWLERFVPVALCTAGYPLQSERLTWAAPFLPGVLSTPPSYWSYRSNGLSRLKGF